jgi:hypothetical protein
MSPRLGGDCAAGQVTKVPPSGDHPHQPVRFQRLPEPPYTVHQIEGFARGTSNASP